MVTGADSDPRIGEPFVVSTDVLVGLKSTAPVPAATPIIAAIAAMIPIPTNFALPDFALVCFGLFGLSLFESLLC